MSIYILYIHKYIKAINLMSNLFYQVGDQRFFNKFLAANYAANHNLPMKFDLYEAEFDKINWLVEPSLTWDQLLDIRVNQIASKNKPIVLNFSGGTDSYTIYKVFERNKIHIDAIYIREWYNEKEQQKEVFDLLYNKIYDPTIKIIVANNDTLFNHTEMYDSPNWIWEKGIRLQYGLPGAGDVAANSYIEKVLGTNDFVSIIGLEKPRLMFTNDGVFSYQDDENYCRPMGDTRIDCFYLNPNLPELHVKQSYMLLKYIRQLEPLATSLSQFIKYSDFHNPSKFNWLDYSLKGCGRFGDLNYSGFAHVTNSHTRLVIPKSGKFDGSEYFGRATELFKGSKDKKVLTIISTE